MSTEWVKKDVWSKRGDNFLVQISRHTEKPSEYNYYEGENRWAVYAYIYPKHRLFSGFSGSDMFQDSATMLPLHCGPSYLQVHLFENGEVSAYQVGADYHHLHDDFTHYAELKDAYQVERDAENLFDFLSEPKGESK